MLKLYEKFDGTLIQSIRVGGPVATVLSPIINPNNLFIEGWHVEDSRSGDKLILLSKDVRDIISRGIAIDDHEVLAHKEDLVRLKDVLELDFKLSGLKVESERGQKYGKVSDFAFETTNFFIQKIYVAQPVYKSITGGSLSIDRSQIVEITNRRIIIEDPTEKEKSLAAAPAS